MQTIQTEPLTAAAFAPFGDVLEANGEFRLINDGMCQRHHDRAQLDFAAEVGP
ncbi:MAG: Ureidoglycolate hydrolase, partial [uncultured bacterium]